MKAKPALTLSLLLAASAALPAGAAALGRAGDADPTFNGGRPVLSDLARTIPRTTYFGNIMADGAGRLLTAGTTSDADGHTAVAIARFGADGTPDAGFGEGGSRVLQLSTGANAYSSPSGLFAVPGRYAGFGVYRFVNQRPVQSAFEIRADGSPDLDVGSGGLAAHDPATAPATANTASATAGPDGSLYVSGVLEQNPSTGANRKLALTRFTPQGLLATGFGTDNGTYIGSFSQAADTGTYGGPLRVLPSGKLLMAGVALLPSGRFGVLLVRFAATSGTIDTSFGTMSGHTLTNASDPSDASADSQPTDMAIGPDGEIYVGGSADDASDNQVAMVARYTPGGVLDPTFGVGGVKRLQLGNVDERSSISKLALQADGKVVAIASVSPAMGGSGTTRLVRLRDDGTLDPTFGNAGVVTPALGGTRSGVSTATILGGRLVVAGYVEDGARTYGAISRYLLDALPDPPPVGPAPPGTPPAGPAPGPGGGGGGGGPQPTPAGKVGFTAKRLSVDAKGRVRVPLTCSSAAACTGRLTLVSSTGRVTIAAAKRAKTYASAKYRLAKATKKTITLTLTKSARAQARRKKGLKARLAISPAGASTKTYTITLGRRR